MGIALVLSAESRSRAVDSRDNKLSTEAVRTLGLMPVNRVNIFLGLVGVRIFVVAVCISIGSLLDNKASKVSACLALRPDNSIAAIRRLMVISLSVAVFKAWANALSILSVVCVGNSLLWRSITVSIDASERMLVTDVGVSSSCLKSSLTRRFKNGTSFIRDAISRMVGRNDFAIRGVFQIAA